MGRNRYFFPGPPMFSIACLSQKGGVGKSTLARLIATSYAEAGWVVKIADFNVKQKTSTDWAGIRMSAGIKPEIAAEPFSQVRLAMKQAPQLDLMVFDGKPDSDVTTLEIAKVADLIVIPTGVSFDDIHPQIRFAAELVTHGIKRKALLFVLNKATDSEISLADAQSLLETAMFPVAQTEILFRTGYQIAQNSGRSILETTFPSLNERARALTDEIAERLSTLTGAQAQ